MGSHGDAQRIINVIRQAVGQETKSASKVDFVKGVVAVTHGNYADIYLNGNESTASENFRVPANVYVNVGDPVLAAIDYGSNLGKWIIEVIPSDTYSKYAINPNDGQRYYSDGNSVPIPFGEDFIWEGTEFVFDTDPDTSEDEFLTV